MNHYEAKQAARKDRLEARADRLSAQASSAFKRADLSEAATGIPFGQPILVGHHSEGRHRAVLKRADAAMRKGIELSKAAKEAAGRAAGVGSGGISSDDPAAVVKLKAELAELAKAQERDKAINAAIRKHAKKGKEAQVAALVALGYSAGLADKLTTSERGYGMGIPSFTLSNRNANMKRIEGRIAQLARAAEAQYIKREHGGELIEVQDPEINRVQLQFPGKPPAAIIAKLKQQGFRWAPSEGAWQRMLNNAGRWAAKAVVEAWEAAQ